MLMFQLPKMSTNQHFSNVSMRIKVTQVSVTVTEDLKFLWFEIWNNGAPFSEEAQVNAQKLFFTEDKGRSGKHYGIGLSFAQAVAVRHGGTMIITNLVNDGVSVKLGIQKF